MTFGAVCVSCIIMECILCKHQGTAVNLESKLVCVMHIHKFCEVLSCSSKHLVVLVYACQLTL